MESQSSADSLSALHIYCTSPHGLVFLFSCTGHEFIFCRGRPEKSSPGRFLVFYSYFKPHSQVASAVMQPKFRERGVITPACSETQSSVLRSTKDALFSVVVVWKCPNYWLCEGTGKPALPPPTVPMSWKGSGVVKGPKTPSSYA